MIDSRSKDQIYKSALFLYDLFVAKSIQKLSVSLLIVANFQDSSDALSAERLREDLEREL